MARAGRGLAGRSGEDGLVGWIALQGAANVRDLGGLPAQDGRPVVAHRLLRGDNLQGLTSADVTLLTDGIGLTTVVDLRSPSEVSAEGPGPLTRVDSVHHEHHSVLAERGAATDAAADALAVRRPPSKSRYPDDVMSDHYLGYLRDRPQQVVGALRSVAHAPGAALVNCAAGKDRTGVVVALALSVAGVQRDAIVADYAASAERIGAILARLRASPTYQADIDSRPPEDHRPRPGTMAAFLDQVDSRYGGVLGWLAGQGFGPEDASELQAKLLLP